MVKFYSHSSVTKIIVNSNDQTDNIPIVDYILFVFVAIPPMQTSPTDLRHFDPTLTNLPPTIMDLITTERALHLEGFDFVATAESSETTTKMEESKNEGETPSGGDFPIEHSTATNIEEPHPRSNGGDMYGSSSEETSDVSTTHVVTAEINDF